MRPSLFFLLVLAGCGSGEQSSQSTDNHGYGFAYDVQSPAGLKLRYSAAADSPIFAMISDPAYFEEAFRKTMACTGLSAPVPFVILTKDLGPDNGRYYSQPSLIVLDMSRPDAMRHESVHYLLDVNTGDPDSSHVSHFFADCQ